MEVFACSKPGIGALEKSEQMFLNSIKWREDIAIPNSVDGVAWKQDRVLHHTTRYNRKSQARGFDILFRDHGGKVGYRRSCYGRKDGVGGPEGLYYDEYALSCTEISYMIYLEEAWALVRKAVVRLEG